MISLSDSLRQLGACQEAITWSKGKTLKTAWKTCKRGDWMLWLCGRMAGKKGWPTRQELVVAACDCAELALPVFEQRYPDDKRPRVAIETARKWAAGKATLEEVRRAADAAYFAAASAAYYAAANTAAAYAAYAAANTAAAYAYYDAYAAYAADAYAAANTDARAKTLSQCAAICRKRLHVGKFGGGK